MEEHQITYNGPPQRLDRIFHEFINLDLSRSSFGKSIEQGKVTINDSVQTKKGLKVRKGDIVVLKKDIEVPTDEMHLSPNSEIPIHVLYEDDDILVINKQAGVAVHPGENEKNDRTLVNGLIHHVGIENLSTFEDYVRPGIVHRLDQETSGVMIVCKTNDAHEIMKREFQQRVNMEKIYYAIVFGIVKEEHGFIEKNITRHPKLSKMMVTDDPSIGKPSLTEYFVEKVWKLDNTKQYSLVRVKLHTGRTHQIRVHFSSEHHPLIGDGLYHKKYKSHFTEQLCLVAKSLSFPHPISGETLSFSVDFPDHFNEFITYLDTHTIITN
eukprot:TRINITY_DN6681_c0_g1_i1.p1 TRINITY_DN6681_c0_g1~~TRINITY_DN6681_c0_g1_i1.p1  ORF type:complete len:365 (+),score=64.25 TRINITY_DN6681_c0_g1_i1:125-1096(+)